MKDKRFEEIYKEGSDLVSCTGRKTILLDKETGVQYLVIVAGCGMSITPLLDEDGRPVVTIPDYKY